MRKVSAILAVIGLTVLLGSGCSSFLQGEVSDPQRSLEQGEQVLSQNASQTASSLAAKAIDFSNAIAPDGTRFALVIGNGKYQKTTPLANPPTDATDVAKLLEDVGFMVTLQTDASLSQMEGTIREFASKAKKASAGTTLFYYAGHGVQFEGTNYLLPVDADIHKDYELRSKAVSMELVSSALNETDSDFNLILLDACRDNPFASSRGGARGLMPMGGGNPESMVVFSTSPGSVAQDGDGSNSPFTTALKQHLLTPDQEVRQLVASVSKSVQTMTKGRQIPWVNTSFTGSFYFVTAEQQLANSKESSSRLEQELQSLENEIAARQKAIAEATDVETLTRLSIEQQKAMAIEAAKRFEVLQAEKLRKQAEEALARQKQEQVVKQQLEAQVRQQGESLSLQAQQKREELERLDLEQKQASGPLGKLETIGKIERSILEIENSFDQTIEKTTNELMVNGERQLAAYKTANPKNPWETLKEFEARVALYKNGLETEGAKVIKALEVQKQTEMQKLSIQLDIAKKGLAGTRYSVAANVEVQPFDAENKRFPILLSGECEGIPFRYQLYHSINSTDSKVLQKEYERVMNAYQAKALVGDIEYVLNEMSASTWVADPVSWKVLNLLEETNGKPRVLMISSATRGSGVSRTQEQEARILWDWNNGEISKRFNIGDFGPAGGYIFYDKGSYSDGWRYMEAAPASIEWGDKVWGGYGTNVGNTATGIGSGKRNTEKIVSTFGYAEPYGKKTDYAAKLCSDLVYGGYDDWYLPSKEELNQMYRNLHKKGIGGFSGGGCWSSSGGNAYFAWYQYFDNGAQGNLSRSYVYRVRPVRAF